MPIAYEILFRAATNIFRHYVAANLDCKPDTISCGERYSTIAMESGRVVTIGNQDDLVESFKEEILGNLPSRFRKMAAKERVKRAKQHAIEQENAAKKLNLQIQLAEEDIESARTSLSQSTGITHMQRRWAYPKMAAKILDDLIPRNNPRTFVTLTEITRQQESRQGSSSRYAVIS